MRLIERLGSTIAAIATAPGSVIGIVRMSGPLSLEIAKRISRRTAFVPRKATLCHLDLGPSFFSEQGIVISFPAPASYTGEDMVEIQVHGAAENLGSIFSHILTLGAQPALPGEFSFRAVINGKMSLSQAGALPTLIGTQNRILADFARRAAFLSHFDTVIERLISRWDEIETIAVATVDFPEQVTDYLPLGEIEKLLDESADFISSVVGNSRRLKHLATARLVIVGRPNVGKSSLFNRLVGFERAIVTAEPGTTRDYLSASLFLPSLGHHIELCDTAGVCFSPTGTEATSVARSLALTEVSDHILFLLDGSVPPTEEDYAIFDIIKHRHPIIAANKSDLPRHPDAALFHSDTVYLSARTGEGITLILEKITERFTAEYPNPEVPVIFHEERLHTAEAFLTEIEACRDAMKQRDIAILAAAISRCRCLVRELAGKSDNLDVYDRIFSSFCLGK